MKKLQNNSKKSAIIKIVSFLASFAIVGIAAVLLTHATTPTDTTVVTDPTYGATGDGSTDDTAALQHALDDANSKPLGDKGRVVYIPAGTYMVSIQNTSFPRRALTVYSHIHLTGIGTIKLANNSGNYGTILGTDFSDDLSGFELDSITIDQNASHNPISNAHDILPNPSNTAITITASNPDTGGFINAQDASQFPVGVFDVIVYTPGGSNFEYMRLSRAGGSNQLVIVARHAYKSIAYDHPVGDVVAPTENSRIAVYALRGSDINIHNVHFTDIGDSVWTVSLNGDDNKGNPGIRSSSIVDNIFDGVGLMPIDHDHSTVYWAGDGLIMTGNTFQARSRGLPGAITAIETHGANQMVSMNKVSNYQAGINFTGASSFESNNLTLSDNTFENVLYGIYLVPYKFGTKQTGYAIQDALINNNFITLDRDQWPTRTSGFGNRHDVAGIILDSDPAQELPTKNVVIRNNTVHLATSSFNDDSDSGVYWVRRSTVTDQDLSIIDNRTESLPDNKSVQFQASAIGTDIARNGPNAVGVISLSSPSPSSSPSSPIPTPSNDDLLGDIDSNGTVNISEAIIAIGHWHDVSPVSGRKSGDKNSDGIVSLGEAIEVLNNWQHPAR